MNLCGPILLGYAFQLYVRCRLPVRCLYCKVVNKYLMSFLILKVTILNEAGRTDEIVQCSFCTPFPEYLNSNSGNIHCVALEGMPN